MHRYPATHPRRRPGWLLALALIGLAATAHAAEFRHPTETGADYCVSRDVIAEFDPESGGYNQRAVDGICRSTVGLIDEATLGVVETFIIPGNCEDGKRNGSEQGVDCGGSCPAQCVECIDPWTSTYWPIAVPTQTSEQIGPRLLQLQDDQLLVRAYDTLFEFADEERKLVGQYDDSDSILEAVAWYVDRHMSWRNDNGGGPNQTCINNVNNLGYNPGWDFPIPASYTVNYTGRPGCTSCTNDFCGDCDDFAILRQALAKRIGISSKCIWDAIDLKSPGLHEYNIVLYQGKYRLMDYGTMDAWLATHTTSMHETENNWNYVYGPREPDAGNEAGDFTHNYPPDGPLSPGSKVDCPTTWNYHTYYQDTCP